MNEIILLPVAAVLYGSDRAFELARDALLHAFGDPIAVSEPRVFEFTSYYEDEVGPAPRKCFMTFEPRQGGGMLSSWKRRAVEDEARICDLLGTGSSRPANIDPGALSLGNLALASTKEARHRIYLGEGIWSEMTLLWRCGRFQPLDWTYQDYRVPSTIEFFTAARKTLVERRRTLGCHEG